MFLDFSWLPPEINSARIFAGAGSGPLHVAAAAWEGLAADLAASASSFDSVIAGLTGGPWSGPASVSMAAAATPYVGWLSAAAAQAQLSAGQARAAATAFESALSATVHPAAVTANRVSLGSLVATNFIGQNTPAIAATEFDYVEMWAQDVGAMVGYQAGAESVASTLTPFALPALDLGGVLSQIGAPFSGILAGAPALLATIQGMAAGLPLQQVMGMGQMLAMPASMMMGPLMQMANSTNAGTAGLGAAAAGLVDAPKFVGDVAPAMNGLGGGGGLGAGMAADLGKARLVGAMSVPPTWQGSMPKGMATSAMSGLGAASAAEMAAGAAGAGGGTGMMPMPMPMGGAGAGGGMPGGMMGRGGGGSHVVQARPSVIPRIGIG